MRATRLRVAQEHALQWGCAALLLLFAALSLAGPSQAAPADLKWLDKAGRPNASARDALRLLVDAAVDGLVPRDYRANGLAEDAARLDAASSTVTSQQSAFERSLERAMHRYLRDLHLGRVDPGALGFRVTRTGAAVPDFTALLKAAAAAGRLVQLAAELRPQLGQ